MSRESRNDPRGSYDTVAEEYARRLASELEHKPFDRKLLDRFAERVRGSGVVADVGCGPGQIARHLHERGVRVVGVDLSGAMVEQARRLHPQIEFFSGDMRSLDVPDAAWGAIVAFYSLIHIPHDKVIDTLRELRRALRPEGPLLLAFHIGEDTVHLDEWWDREVSVDFFYFRSQEMRGYLHEAGFFVEEVMERDPYAEGVEAQTRRCYVVARAR